MTPTSPKDWRENWNDIKNRYSQSALFDLAPDVEKSLDEDMVAFIESIEREAFEDGERRQSYKNGEAEAEGAKQALEELRGEIGKLTQYGTKNAWAYRCDDILSLLDTKIKEL